MRQENNVATQFEELKKKYIAGEINNAAELCHLGLYFLSGEKIKQDANIAIACFMLAATKFPADYMGWLYLGISYLNEGETKHAESFQYLKRACELNEKSFLSYKYFGYCYQHGIGTTKNKIEASNKYAISLENLVENIKFMRRKKIQDEELNTALKQSEEIREQLVACAKLG